MRHLSILLLCALLGLSACQPVTKREEKPLVMVSIEPLRYFAEQIAGDRFEIVSMVPKGSAPETYDPTPQQMVYFSQAKAFLRIGDTPFERMWIEKLEENTPDLHFFSLSEGIKLLEMEGHYHHMEDGTVIHHADSDPHIWSSVTNAVIIARNIAKAFCKIDAANAELFRRNLASLLRQIDTTKQQVDGYMAEADSTFLIYHPALTYFARDYGIRQLSLEFDGKQPSPDRLRSLVHDCKEKGTRILFLQTEIDERNAQVLQKELNLAVSRINLLDYDWHTEMVKVAKALHRSHRVK